MKRIIALLLFFTLFMSGCSFIMPPIPEETPEVSEESASLPGVTAVTTTPKPEHDKRFTLLWNPDLSTNPLSGTSQYNLRLAGLLYEGLFRINPDFTYEPVLCESWESDDGINWSFKLKSGIFCHDGSELGIFDVIGSLRTAAETGRFASRLSNINTVGTKDGAVTVTLKLADFDFPALLDVPIMKDRTAYTQSPVGCGPYKLDLDTATLGAFTAHRDYEKLPLKTIYLAEVANEDLIPAFDSGIIDLVVENKSDTGTMEFSAGSERRGYVTNIMHFVGFNPWRSFCSDPVRRKILASIIDRVELSRQSLTDVEPSVLPLPPGSPYYVESIAESALIPAENLEEWIASATIRDYDGDGKLDFVNDYGCLQTVNLEFIVYRSNLKKVNAAKQIAGMLSGYGISVTLRELTWDEYTSAVSLGNYDLYYGSVQISPNFSMMPLFDDRGTARSVAYDSQLDMLATEFQTADPGDWKTDAANRLLQHFCESMPFTPLVFERGAVLTNRGVVTNAVATQYNPFYNITEWKIDLSGGQ